MNTIRLLMATILLAAVPAGAATYEYWGPNVIYNDARHEYVVSHVRTNLVSADPDEVPILRRFRTDGTRIGDVEIASASPTAQIGIPSMSFDPAGQRLLVAWTENSTIRGVVVDANSYQVVRRTTIKADDTSTVGIGTELTLVHSPSNNRHYVGYVTVGGEGRVIVVKPDGVRESEFAPLSSVNAGGQDVLSLAAAGSSGTLIASHFDMTGSAFKGGVTSIGVAGTASLTFDDLVRFHYTSVNDRFLAVYGTDQGVKARRIRQDGTVEGGQVTLAATASFPMMHDSVYNPTSERLVVAVVDDDLRAIRIRQSKVDGTSATNLATITGDDDDEVMFMRIAADTTCATSFAVAEVFDGDQSLQQRYRSFGKPCLSHLSAEPNPVMFTTNGMVSIRANRGAMQIKSVKILAGAGNYAVVTDECSGRLVHKDDVCTLQFQVIGVPLPGAVRITADTGEVVDLGLNGSATLDLSPVNPPPSATAVDPAAVGLVFRADGGMAVARYRVSLCKDAGMTQCESTTSTVRATK